jgi:hypothetical protein
LTLPGLPMFGHGQIEGFREKYGMEYRKPKWDEAPDEALVRGHEWKIFPLLHRRGLFAGVEQFHLFDFYGSGGTVNEDVLAYTNRQGEDRSLVIYNNKYDSTRGWIRVSAAALDKSAGHLVQRSLGEALGLPRAGLAVFRDYASHLEYIRPCGEIWEQGLFAELGGYQHHAFLDWRFVDGADWRQVCEALNGSGVESVGGRRQELFGRPLPSVPPPASAVSSVVKKSRKKAAVNKALTSAGKKVEQKPPKAGLSPKPSSAPRKTAKLGRAPKATVKTPSKRTGATKAKTTRRGVGTRRK